MQTIVLAGWRTGLQKIELANLQRELLYLPLKEAKQNVDWLLEVEAGVLPITPVVLQVPNEVSIEFFSRATELGALVVFASFSAAKTPAQRSAKLTPATSNPSQAA